MKEDRQPIANPYVMLREEFDDWAILFNPDTGCGFGLSPTGVYVWKLLDGEHTINAMLNEIGALAEDVPSEAEDHIRVFVETLVAEGLAGYEGNRCHLPGGPDGVEPHGQKLCSLSEHVGDDEAFKYERPELVDFGTRRQAAHGAICSSGSTALTGCTGGGCATTCSNGGGECDCNNGNNATGAGVGCYCGHSAGLNPQCPACMGGGNTGFNSSCTPGTIATIPHIP